MLFIVNKNDYYKLDKNLFHKIGVVKEKKNKPGVVINYNDNTCDIIDDNIYNAKVFNHFEDK